METSSSTPVVHLFLSRGAALKMSKRRGSGLDGD